MFGEMGIGDGDTHREEIESNLIIGIVDDAFPVVGIAIRMVDNHEVAIGSSKFGSTHVTSGGNTIITFQPPYHSLITSFRYPLGTRG